MNLETSIKKKLGGYGPKPAASQRHNFFTARAGILTEEKECKGNPWSRSD